MGYVLTTVIILSVTFLLITAMLSFYTYLLFKRLRTLPIIKKETKVINYLKQFTHGHATGWLLGVTEKHGRKIVTFAPDDLTEEELEKNKEQDKAIIEKVVTTDLHIVAKGKGSIGCNIAYIFPKDIETLVAQMPEGSIKQGFALKDGFSKGMVIESVMKTFGSYVQIGDEATADLIKLFGKGEISREMLIKLMELKTEGVKDEEKTKITTRA